MADNFAYAGIDIGGTNVKFGLIDKSGNIIHKNQRPTLAEKGSTPLMHLITNIGEQLMLLASEENLEIKSLGVGTAGAVDFSSGKVVGPCPNIPGWQGMEVGKILRERLNIPVYVDNDVNAMALAESTFGSAVGYKDVVCLTLGTGVGGGLIINGKVYRGADSSAGELGHMTINFDGPVCKCGNKGCFEVYCSSQAILGRAKAMLKKEMTDIFEEVLKGDLDQLTIKKFFIAYRKGDKTANYVLEETATYVGAGVGGVVNLFNPSVVVIGGGIAEGSNGFIDLITKEVGTRAFSSAVENLKIVKAALGNDAGFIGAGLLGETIKE